MLWNFGKLILQYCSNFKEKTKKIQPKICIKFFKLPGILARLRQSLCKSNFSNFCPSSNNLQFTSVYQNDFSLHVVCKMGWNLVGFHTFPTLPFVYFNMTIIKAYHSHSWKKGMRMEWIYKGEEGLMYSFRK